MTCVQARNEGGGKGGTFLLAPNQCEDAELLWEAPKSPNTVASTLFNTVNLLPKELRFDHVGSKLKFCPIKKKFGSKVNLLFTDTDSLCCEIETEDFSKIFQLTSKKNLTLQISHQTILQPFQQESIRRLQECVRMRLEGKSSKSLLACERSYTQSRNLMVKKKKL